MPLRLVHVEGGSNSGSSHVVLTLASRLSADFDSSVCWFGVRAPSPFVVESAERLAVPWRSVLKHSRYDASAVPRLGDALTALRPDIVVLHGFGAYGMGTLAARLSGARLVVRFEHQPELVNDFYRLVSAATAGWLDGSIAVSRSVLDHVAEQGTRLPSPAVVYNGLELAGLLSVTRPPFAPSAHPPVVLMTARLDAPKDHSTLLRAVALLAAEGRPVQLRFAGEGPRRDALQAEATLLGIGDRVELLGYCPDVATLLEGADVFVLSTWLEGFGLSVVEAMAAARPVIASAVDALPELVRHGETGLLAAPQDAPAMAAALRRYLDDPSWAVRVGLAARADVRERFPLARSLEQFRAYILRLARSRGLESAA